LEQSAFTTLPKRGGLAALISNSKFRTSFPRPA
jgi:hypothetical protein